MNRFVLNCLVSGMAGGVLSQIASAVYGRAERGRSDLPMHAVSHIAWDDDPESHKGRHTHNYVIGTALHHGASIFWATFFEALFGRAAERSTGSALVGGATIAAAAYVTDYHVVPQRLTPGWEYRLSRRSLAATYIVLALTLSLCGILGRRR